MRNLVPILFLSFLLSGNASEEREDPSHADHFPSLVIKAVRGRLGNHIWGYMQALGIELNYQVESLISRESYNYLEPYFKDIRFRVAEDICGYDEYYKAFLRYLDERVIEWYEMKAGRSLEIPRASDGRLDVPLELHNRWKVKTYDLIAAEDFWPRFKPNFNESCARNWIPYLGDLEGLKDPEKASNKHWHLWPGHVGGDQANLYEIPGFTERFLEELQFKDQFVEHGQSVLQEVKVIYDRRQAAKKPDNSKKKRKKRKELIFVGIHCRRTDHIEFEKQHSQIPVDLDYYFEAMQMFRQNMDNKKQKVLFVFVSDDMDWGKMKIGTKDKKGDIFFMGNNEIDDKVSIGNDLALLAQCNHTILSYGTYSYFAGVFAGGAKIVPEHFARHRNDASWVVPLTKDPFEHPLPRISFFSNMEKVPKNERKLTRAQRDMKRKQEL